MIHNIFSEHFFKKVKPQTEDIICKDGTIFTTPGKFRRGLGSLVYEFHEDGLVRILGEPALHIPWAELGFRTPEISSVWGDGTQHFICVSGCVIKNDGAKWKRCDESSDAFYELGAQMGRSLHWSKTSRVVTLRALTERIGTTSTPMTAFLGIHNLNGRILFRAPRHLHEFSKDLRFIQEHKLSFCADVFFMNGKLAFVGLGSMDGQECLSFWNAERGWACFALPKRKMLVRAISCDGIDLAILLNEELLSIKIEELLS